MNRCCQGSVRASVGAAAGLSQDQRHLEVEQDAEQDALGPATEETALNGGAEGRNGSATVVEAVVENHLSPPAPPPASFSSADAATMTTKDHKKKTTTGVPTRV